MNGPTALSFVSQPPRLRYGVRQNEDGTFSWKFDPYVRSWPPTDLARNEIRALWRRITCPTQLGLRQ